MPVTLTDQQVVNPTFLITEVESDEVSATLAIEPLEQGYGHTVGNSLRRVMLSSLPGAAIKTVRIEGVDHQFTTLEGMSEDIVEFILNLKQLKIKATSKEEEGTMHLDVDGEGDITAADIDGAAGFEIVNPDQHLASLAKGKSLRAEIVVGTGTGYSMAQDRKSNVIGEIPVDALYSPITKVSYTVEETRVGRRTDFDKVLLTIHTDGTIEPQAAVEQAAKILIAQFNQIVDPFIPETKDEKDELTPEEAETLRLTVEELNLPTRIANALRKGGFENVGNLVDVPKDTVAKVKNLGEKSVEVIDEALKEKGVSLGE